MSDSADDAFGDFVMVGAAADEPKPVRAIVSWRPLVASVERRLLVYLLKKAIIASVHLYGAHWTALRLLEWVLGV